MAVRILRPLAALTLGAAASALLPLAASATTSQFYAPPKVIKQGAATTPNVGKGTVRLKVFVKKNGTVGAISIVKSTNHGDDATAMEIAKASTYKPGARDGVPIDAFYTMDLKFTSSGVQADAGSGASAGASGGGLAQANALVRAGKYADAKTEINAYLVSHPNDPGAEALLGVADAYLKDAAGATAAFDAAGTIPDRFKIVAAQAYGDAAVDALKAKSNDQAAALATKGLALQSNVNLYYIRGTAYANAQKYPQATADLEKAKELASTGHADATTINAIDASLATSYILGGQVDKGTALAKSVKQRDPSNTRIDDALAAYYNQQAVTAMNAGKRDDAVAALEQGAAAVPSRAPALYVSAANALSSGNAPDWKRVKAEADKALALSPNDPRANFIAGIALANSNDAKNAIPYLQKAKANAGSDTDLNNQIDAALKKLGAK